MLFCIYFCMLKELLNENYLDIITKLFNFSEICEIRIRENRNLLVKTDKQRVLLDYKASKEDIDRIIRVATCNSLYASEDEVRKGFLKFKGIRIGLAGEVVTDYNKLITFKNFTSLVLRIPHEIIGVGDKLNLNYENFQNTLVISPPYGGKTTLIRDIARILSKRYDTLIIDEREEIYNEAFTFGQNVDVIRNAPKDMVLEGIIRALSPEIIVLDELLPQRDLSVIEEITRCGIKLVASLHGNNFEVIKKLYPRITNYFNNVITLSNIPKVGSIKSVVRI